MVKSPPVSAGDSRDAGSIPGSGDPLVKEVATQSSILAWEIPHGQRSLAGYSSWGRKKSDTTKHKTEKAGDGTIQEHQIFARILIPPLLFWHLAELETAFVFFPFIFAVLRLRIVLSIMTHSSKSLPFSYLQLCFRAFYNVCSSERPGVTILTCSNFHKNGVGTKGHYPPLTLSLCFLGPLSLSLSFFQLCLDRYATVTPGTSGSSR